MTPEEEIASNRRAITNKLAPEIMALQIQEENKRDNGTRSALWIACAQELSERQKKKEAGWNAEKMEILKSLGETHWSVPFTFWVALAAAAIAFGAWLFPRPPKDTPTIPPQATPCPQPGLTATPASTPPSGEVPIATHSTP